MARKLALSLAGLAGLAVLAFAGVVLLLQTGAASQRVKDLVVPRVSAALGREVTVEGARLRVLPNPRVALTGTTLAGRPGEPPLARLASLDVELGLWPLVRSLGKDVRVNGLTLVRPEVNLVRARDGTWNYEGLGGGAATAAKEPAPPAGAKEREGVRFSVARARLEDGALRVVDRSQGRDDAAVALTRIDLAAEGGVGEPVAAKLAAALAAEQQNVELELRSPHLPEKLGPGSYPELTGRLALRGIALQRLRGLLPANVAQVFTGGLVDAEADLRTASGATAYLLEGRGRLADLKLRGEPASGSFTLRGRAEPRGAAKVEIADLAVKGPGVDLGGSVAAELPRAGAVRARFAIAGPLLDLGAVLGLVPQGPDAPSKPAEAAPEGALLPPSLAREVAQVAVAGTLELGKVVNGKLTATDVKARAALKEGVLALEQASAGLYGGRVDAGGTEVHLADAHPRWRLRARLDQVDLGQAFQAVAGAAPLAGKATGSLDLAGVGSNWDQLKQVLTGLGALSLKEGALTSADLGGEALGAVAKGLEAVGRGGAAKRVAGLEGGKTTLRDLAASFTVKDGFLALSRPLSFATPAGAVRLGGRIGLGQELALDGAFDVSKDALARAGLPLGRAVTLPLRLGGTLTAPSVQLDASKAASGAAAGLVAEKRRDVQQKVERQARRKAEDLLQRFRRSPRLGGNPGP